VAAIYTVDASVFVNAYNETELGHAASLGFLTRIRRQSSVLVEPTLFIVEASGAIARASDDPQLAYAMASDFAMLPGLILVPLDPTLASDAAKMAAERRLRGADAVYAAVAQRFNAVLVTRDREQRERLTGVLTTLTPEEALSADEG
jgi:predicted nucleic acid-binding protein